MVVWQNLREMKNILERMIGKNDKKKYYDFEEVWKDLTE
jgi:hypothetical protein